MKEKDAVLGLLSSKYLFATYPHIPCMYENTRVAADNTKAFGILS
jgi:hypothetical protein